MAVYGVIDKLGFMDPGTLCPSDYLTWQNRPSVWAFIFQRLPGSEEEMKRFMKERNVRSMCEEVLDLTSAPQRTPKTMREIRFDAILAAYDSNGKNAQAACRELGISKATFYRELSRHKWGTVRQLKKKERET